MRRCAPKVFEVLAAQQAASRAGPALRAFQKGAAPSTYFRFPLLHAAQRGDLRAVRSLLHRVQNPPDQPERLGTTPLLAAIQKNHEQIVETLLAGGADPCVAGTGKLTPLMHAAITGDARVASLLLRYGAGDSVPLQDMNGDTALDLAVAEENWVVANVIANAWLKRADRNERVNFLAYMVRSQIGFCPTQFGAQSSDFTRSDFQGADFARPELHDFCDTDGGESHGFDFEFVVRGK